MMFVIPLLLKACIRNRLGATPPPAQKLSGGMANSLVIAIQIQLGLESPVMEPDGSPRGSKCSVRFLSGPAPDRDFQRYGTSQEWGGENAVKSI